MVWVLLRHYLDHSHAVAPNVTRRSIEVASPSEDMARVDQWCREATRGVMQLRLEVMMMVMATVTVPLDWVFCCRALCSFDISVIASHWQDRCNAARCVSKESLQLILMLDCASATWALGFFVVLSAVPCGLFGTSSEDYFH